MAGGDHLVVDKFFARTQMTSEAFFCAANQILGVVESERHGLGVCLGSRGVRSQPGQSRSMTALAAYAFGDVKVPGFLFRRDIECMAEQTLGSMRGVG